MPDSGIADTTVFTSSFYDTYIRNQVIVTCTAGTRPTGTEGRFIYETDTDRLKCYDGSNWQTALQLGGAGSRIGGSWTRTSTLAVAVSTDITPTFENEVYDYDGLLTPTSGVITLTEAGVWVVSCSLKFNLDPGSSTSLWLTHVKSATNVLYSTEAGSGSRPNDGADFWIGMTAMVVGSAGDTLTFTHRNSGGEDIIAGWLDIYRMAA